MQDYSVTYASQISSLVGLLGLILPRFHILISSTDLETGISGAFVLGGIVVALYQRYKKGGVTPLGFKNVTPGQN
jgi:hypothetical protein